METYDDNLSRKRIAVHDAGSRTTVADHRLWHDSAGRIHDYRLVPERCIRWMGCDWSLEVPIEDTAAGRSLTGQNCDN